MTKCLSCRVEVLGTIPHKDRRKKYDRFDIALLQLAHGINTNTYTPVCLPKIGKTYYGEEGVAVGEMKDSLSRRMAQSFRGWSKIIIAGRNYLEKFTHS